MLRSLALSLSSRALNQALAPIGQGLFSGIFGSLLRGGLQGGALGQVTSLAGGAVSSSGSIGSRARAEGGRGGVNVVFHVTTPDAQSFRRAEGEVAAMLARAVARGQRGL